MKSVVVGVFDILCDLAARTAAMLSMSFWRIPIMIFVKTWLKR